MEFINLFYVVAGVAFILGAEETQSSKNST